MLWMFNYCSFSQVYPLCVVAEDYGTARCLHGHNMAIPTGYHDDGDVSLASILKNNLVPLYNTLENEKLYHVKSILH